MVKLDSLIPTLQEEKQVSTNEIKALIRRNIEQVWAKGNLDAHEELSHSHRVTHRPVHGKMHGHAEHKSHPQSIQNAFSDVHITIDHLIAEGDMAAARLTIHAKHTGEFWGIAPTGKEIKITGIHMYRIEDGKIAEAWSEEDLLGLLRQLGVMPAMTLPT
jgi:predicted ester cyclase